MWIKQTSVQKKGAKRVYYQLMKTVYTPHGSRQIVVANLGRAENVELALAKRLAASITDESYLFLPEETLSLLDAKLYGEIYLLNKAFEITSLRRFLEDHAKYKGLSAASVDALFYLLSYYSFQFGEMSSAQFSKRYFIRNSENVTPDSIREAFLLLPDASHIHPGILTNYNCLKNSDERKCFYFLHVKTGRDDNENLLVSLMTDKNSFPLSSRICKKNTLDALDPSGLYLYESFFPELLSVWDRAHFIVQISRPQLRKLLPPAQFRQVMDLPCKQRYGDLAYGMIHVGDFSLVVLKPGDSPQNASFSGEILLCNDALPPHEVINYFSDMNDIRDCFYSVFLPKDLQDICSGFSPAKLQNDIVTLHFLRLFLDQQLSVKLEPLNLTARDAYDLWRPVKIATLEYGHRKQLIHSIYTPMQTRILEFLAFK